MGAETRIQLDLARKVTTMTSVGAIVGGLATGAVYVLLGLLLLDGQIPLAAAATCVLPVQSAQRSLATAVFQVDRVYDEGVHVRDYTLFLHRAAEQTTGEAGTHDPGLLRQLVVDGVSLRYADRPTSAVDEVTLIIKQGETVAFVGENGSGKSSLATVIGEGGIPGWNIALKLKWGPCQGGVCEVLRSWWWLRRRPSSPGPFL